MVAFVAVRAALVLLVLVVAAVGRAAGEAVDAVGRRAVWVRVDVDPTVPCSHPYRTDGR